MKIFDENVSLARLTGTNKQYIEKIIPHISSLLCSSLDDILTTSEVLVIGNRLSVDASLFNGAEHDHVIIDLVRINEALAETKENYQGICW